MPDCTILHIEDSESDHILFKRDLEKLAFSGQYQRVDSFDRAKEYLSEVTNSNAPKPDLIIADSKLGIYNGLDIVQWVRGNPGLRDLPVVVYSAAISPKQQADVLRAGATACLTKPIESRETLVALQIILSYVNGRCQKQSHKRSDTTAERVAVLA